MRRISIWIPVVAFLLGSCLVAGEPLATAGPKVVFVSASGNDANPCTRTQPCRTLAAAVAVVATGGEVVVLDSGSFGTVLISKSLTIEAAPGIYAGINATTDGIDIGVSATDKVVLRGLTIYGTPGSSVGIYLASPGTLHIEGCVIQGFGSYGLLANGMGHLFVRDTIFRNMGTDGVWLAAPPTMEGLFASFDHCRFENNTSYGALLIGGVQVAIRDSVISGNSNGVVLSTSEPGADVTVENCLAFQNSGVGLGFDQPNDIGTLRISGSTVSRNGIGLQGPAAGGGVLESFGNNHVRGNTTNISGTITPVNND